MNPSLAFCLGVFAAWASLAVLHRSDPRTADTVMLVRAPLSRAPLATPIPDWMGKRRTALDEPARRVGVERMR